MKNNRNPLYSAVHYALAAGVVSGFGASGVAVAQDEDVAELERVEVTGSRIKRTDIEGPNPVFVMQREDIEQTGLVTIGEILENLPIAGSGLNLNFNNGGNGAILLDLRNLGSNRLLVLVNGRRWVNFPASAAVDLTTIPSSIIERVEILKDGASAIYGSDAISGVVNIITRGDFTGAQGNIYYGEFDDGDGEQTQADFSIGSASDRASVFMNINVAESKPVFAGDRAISKEPTFGTGNAFGSSGTPQGRFIFYDEQGNFNDLTLNRGEFYPDGAPLSAFRPWNGAEDPYNFAPDNYLLTPNERKSIFVQGEYEITDNISFFSNALYSNRHSRQTLAANPLFLGEFAGESPATCVSEDQPFNPFGIRLGSSCGGSPYLIGRRLLEANNRIFTQDSDTYHFTGGIEGSFEMAGRFWDWETYYLFQRTEIQETGVGEQNVARIQQMLGDPADCTAPCVPLNVWGAAPRDLAQNVVDEGSGTITQDMLDFMQASTDEFQFSERNMYAANLTGTLFDLPAGPLGVAVGYEYRREKGRDEPDYLRETGQLAGNAIAATAGSFSVDEAYVEFAVPILADMPGIDILEASLATRYSDYSTFGNTTNSKVGLRWQPYSDLLVRGTYSEGFRAASVGELFQGALDSFLPIEDPCSDMLAIAGGEVLGGRDNPQPQNIIDNCIADGVPANGAYRQVNPQIRVTLGGNPDLQPETSESNTFGLVYSPEFVDGLDVTLDYFDIEITQAISSIGAQTILDGCYEGGNTLLCNLIDRGSGGTVTDLRNVATNIGGIETKGMDLGVNYSFPETPVGFFEVQWDTTYTDEYTQFVANQTGGTDAIEFVGQNIGDVAIPEFKSNLYLDWSFGDWAANYTLRYIDGMTEDCGISVDFGLCTDPEAVNEDGNLDPDNHLESVVYHDAQVSYHYTPWDTRFSVGARNLFDKDPPVAFTPFANSYNPTTYDVPGRFWYVRVTTNF